MNPRDDLPKLGKDATWKRAGRIGVELGPEEDTLYRTARPDYNNFKIKQYNSEDRCAGALVGLPSPNRVRNHYDEIISSIHEKSISPISFEFIMRLSYLFTEIKEVIDIGIQIEVIRVANINPTIKQKGPFSLSRNLHTIDFLNWMQQNGYPIPDELAFHKNDFGELQWDEGTTAQDTAKNTIDYSKKNKSDLRLLVNRWIDEEGITRKQVVMRLYEDDFNSGVPMTTLLSRVDRLRGVKTS